MIESIGKRLFVSLFYIDAKKFQQFENIMKPSTMSENIREKIFSYLEKRASESHEKFRQSKIIDVAKKLFKINSSKMMIAFNVKEFDFKNKQPEKKLCRNTKTFNRETPKLGIRKFK